MNNDPGFWSEVVTWFTQADHWSGQFGVPNRLAEHLIMSFVSVAIGAAIALPLGMWIGHRRRFEFLVASVANLGRAIPSFGLLFLFVVWLGIGLRSPASLRPPVIFALVLLAIPPILTNTYIGIQNVAPETLEAARGMGMTGLGILRHIELPLGVPLIMAGLRTASVQVVATATLAAVVAGGGLGRFIIDGFAAGRREQIFAGAVLVALLAIVTEVAFGLLERAASPRTKSEGPRRPSAPIIAASRDTGI
ncbi:MAG: ABC transporter permease [Actinomycetota bacterium]